MRTLFKQTALLFASLVLASVLVAGIFFVFIKKSEDKNRLLAERVLKKPIESTEVVNSSSSTIIEEVLEKKEVTSSTEDVKAEEKNEEKKEEVVVVSSTPATTYDKVLWEVPFVSQAPFGDWSDPKQEAGCEETSLLMAVHWITGKPLTSSIALKEIIDMSNYELEHYGNYYDSSIIDTLKLFKDYFGYTKAYVKYDIGLEDIKKALKNQNVVQVPVVGTLLGNPYFTPPGPPVHQILIIGYDDEKREFIANDPGTRHGAKYHYKYSTLMTAIRDYPSGYNEINRQNVTAMLVIAKNQE